MNKNLFFGMFAATGMLLATSCSNDELDSVRYGNEAQVTFSLGLEDGIVTRAISDGTGAKKLVCAVYDADDNVIKTVSINNTAVDENGQYVNTNAFQGGLKDQVSVTLAKGQEYTMVFWAQNSACNAYSTDDLAAVGVTYTDGNENGDINNDETRDAFYAAETFTVQGDKEINVTLKRPFAQINVGVTTEDWEAAVASGITIEKSSVVIKNAATSINLLTGEVGKETTDAEVTYIANAIPEGEMLKVDTDGDGEDEEYYWLSMSYILVADHDATADENGLLGTDKATLQGLQYTFTPTNRNSIVFEEGLAGAPVRRNWRTNILGKILTGNLQFNITIDPAYDGDYIYPSKAEEELEFAATFGGTYTMNGNVDLNTHLDVNADFTLEGQGNTLDVKNANNYGMRAFNGTATINNVNLTSDQGGVSVANGAKVVFNSGSVKTGANTNPRYNFYVTGAGSTAIINGGNFSFSKTLKRAYIYADAGTTVYVNGGTFGVASTRDDYTAGIITNDDGKVIITGGTFGFDPSTWVADGYKAVKSGENWIVVVNDVAVATTLDEVKTVFTNGGKVILANDIKFEKITPVEEGKEVYLDLNGKTITVNENTTSNTLIWVKDGGKLTIDGNGTIDLGSVSTMAIFCPYGELVIENGTFIRNKVTTVTDATTGLFMGAKNSGCNVTINGGYFDAGYYDANAADIEGFLDGTATITETVDDIAKRGKPGDANLVRVAVKDNVSVLLNHSGYGSFKVYGGTFVGANPAWGDEGCMLPTTPNYLRPWSYYQGALLAGQTFNENGLVIPDGYTITKSVNADNVPVYTVTYDK